MEFFLRGPPPCPIHGHRHDAPRRMRKKTSFMESRLPLPSDRKLGGPVQGSGRVTFTGPFGPLPGLRAMATIGDQLQTYRLALTEAQAKGESAIASKIEQQIKELEEFQQRHPEEAEAPSPFEVFCDLNPSDINCRVYDD
jgi:hypothetical protein